MRNIVSLVHAREAENSALEGGATAFARWLGDCKVEDLRHARLVDMEALVAPHVVLRGARRRGRQVAVRWEVVQDTRLLRPGEVFVGLGPDWDQAAAEGLLTAYELSRIRQKPSRRKKSV